MNALVTLTMLTLMTQVNVEASTAVGFAEQQVRAGDFAKATQSYGAALAAGSCTADVLFNMGTAAQKAGDNGIAVLALERAHRIAPADEDIAFNLQQALKSIPGPLSATAQVARPGAFLLRLSIFSWQRNTLILLGISLLIAMAYALLWRRIFARRLCAALLMILLLVDIAGLWATHQRTAISQRGDAVVLGTDVVIAREAPDGQAPQSFVLPPGFPLRSVAVHGDFVRIQLGNGLEAWLPAASIAEVEGLSLCSVPPGFEQANVTAPL